MLNCAAMNCALPNRQIDGQEATVNYLGWLKIVDARAVRFDANFKATRNESTV